MHFFAISSHSLKVKMKEKQKPFTCFVLLILCTVFVSILGQGGDPYYDPGDVPYDLAAMGAEEDPEDMGITTKIPF